MSLEACRECETSVSTEAKSCPHCGAPHPGRRTNADATKDDSDALYTHLPKLGLFLLAVLAIVLVANGGRDRRSTPVQTTRYCAVRPSDLAAEVRLYSAGGRGGDVRQVGVILGTREYHEYSDGRTAWSVRIWNYTGEPYWEPISNIVETGLFLVECP